MKKDIEQVNIQFYDAAQKCFFNVCNRFEQASGDREKCKHETEYIQMHAMYMALLKNNLEAEALSLMERYGSKYDIFLLQKAMTLHIDRYLGEFKFKYRLGI